MVEADDVRADAFHLPFRDGSIATVVADPDWNDNWQTRWKLVEEIGRVARPGARLYLNAPWIPTSGKWVVDAVWVVHLRWGMPRNASLVTVSHRRP